MQKLRFNEKIYTYQIDFVGHVNNIIYIQWLENGRVRLLEAMGFPPQELAHSAGVMPVLTETRIVYKRPLFLFNSPTIEVWISKLNNASAIIEFRILNENGELCTEAQQKGLFIDRHTQRPARMTAEQRAGFEKFLING
jgi:acyl-CoA thioester hydrolase